MNPDEQTQEQSEEQLSSLQNNMEEQTDVQQAAQQEGEQKPDVESKESSRKGKKKKKGGKGGDQGYETKQDGSGEASSEVSASSGEQQAGPEKVAKETVSQESKRLKDAKKLLDQYYQETDPSRKAGRFVALLRHMLKYPEREIVDLVFKIFRKHNSAVALSNFRANISDNYSHQAQKRLSYLYTTMQTAADCIRQGKDFPLDLNACRAAIQCDEIVDYLAEKLHK